ncbi:MAG TPA: hypothetical protein VJU86_10550 [Pyrinomonadaceae bacterium]|nr:hypothetical protein [Pyrinomonadaceae bacterium]
MTLLKSAVLLFAIVSLHYSFPQSAEGQMPPVVTERLRSPASVRGFIGGESHDSYVVHASRGRILTVSLSWRREGNNRAQFTVTESTNTDGESVKFGKWSHSDKRWSGKVPKSGDYLIRVFAHPTAHYTLKVTVR